MYTLLFYCLTVAVCGFHILLRRHREPVSRLAWLVVVLVLPFAGALAYLLLGSTSIGRKRIERLKDIYKHLPLPQTLPGWDAPENDPPVPPLYRPLFKVGESISLYPVVGGNSAELMADSDSGMDQMAADIDAATDHVHILFYIWLTDHNGTKIIDAMKRAAARG